MNGSTVVISPPDGDMAVYLASLERLRTIKPRLRAIAPGHGHLIEDPYGKIDEYVTHRHQREAQVIAALRAAGTATPAQLVEAIYVDTPDELKPVAACSVWAHLRKLAAEGAVTGDDAIDGAWRPA
jgi:hydroxyacylglutathione hydrolase